MKRFYKNEAWIVLIMAERIHIVALLLHTIRLMFSLKIQFNFIFNKVQKNFQQNFCYKIYRIVFFPINIKIISKIAPKNH